MPYSKRTIISMGLDPNSHVYGDISNYPHLDKLNNIQAEALSRALFMKLDLSSIPNLWDIPGKHLMAMTHSKIITSIGYSKKIPLLIDWYRTNRQNCININADVIYFVFAGLLNDPEYGDISHLYWVPKNHKQARLLSLGLGNAPEYGDISQVKNLHLLEDHHYVFLSSGFGSEPLYGDISQHPDLESLSEEQCKYLSLGLGSDRTYTDISDYEDLCSLGDFDVRELADRRRFREQVSSIE